MWTERPNPLKDGLIIAAAVGLTMCAILSIRNADDAKQSSSSQCQEVVAKVEKNGSILAQCPHGTYIELFDGNVICRCGKRREPESIEVDPSPPFLLPAPNQNLPNAEPSLQPDDKGVWL